MLSHLHKSAGFVLASMCIVIFSLINCKQKEATAQSVTAKIPVTDSLMQVLTSSGQVVGTGFPAFAYRDIDGKTITSKKLSNQIVVYNFMFLGCAPCIAEKEGLKKVINQYHNAKEVEFVCFTFEPSERIFKDSSHYSGIGFRMVCLSNLEIEKLKSFCTCGYPLNIVVDKKGIIRYFKSGGADDVKEASEAIYRDLTKVINAYL